MKRITLGDIYWDKYGVGGMALLEPYRVSNRLNSFCRFMSHFLGHAGIDVNNIILYSY